MTVHPPYPPPSGTQRWRHAPRWVAVVGVAAIIGAIVCCGYLTIAGLNGAANELAAPTPGYVPGSVAPTSAPPRTPAPDQVPVGQGIDVEAADRAFVATVLSTQMLRADEYDLGPQEGVFLAAQVEVRSVSGEMYAFAPDWRLVAADGRVYEATFRSLKDKATFTGGQIITGQKTGGWITFDVPEDALKGGRIQLTVTRFVAQDIQLYWLL